MQRLQDLLDERHLAPERLGRGLPCALVAGQDLGAEGLAPGVERDGDVRGLLVPQEVDEHRGEPVDRVRVLPRGRREVLRREREERAVGHGVSVDEQEARSRGGRHGCQPIAHDPHARLRPERRPDRDAVPATPSTPDTPRHAYEAMGLRTEGTLIERMGIELGEVGADRVTARMPVAGNTQPAGLLHGVRPSSSPRRWGPSPRSCTGPGRAAVGIEVNATHHRGCATAGCTARRWRCTADARRQATRSSCPTTRVAACARRASRA